MIRLALECAHLPFGGGAAIASLKRAHSPAGLCRFDTSKTGWRRPSASSEKFSQRTVYVEVHGFLESTIPRSAVPRIIPFS